MRQLRQLIAVLGPIAVPEAGAMLVARQAEVVASLGEAMRSVGINFAAFS